MWAWLSQKGWGRRRVREEDREPEGEREPG